MRTEIIDTWSYWDNKNKKEVALHYTLVFINGQLKRIFNFFSQPKGYLTEVKPTSAVFTHFQQKHTKAS